MSEIREASRRKRRLATFLVVGLAVAAIGWLAFLELRARGAQIVVGGQIVDVRASRASVDRPAPTFTLPRLGDRTMQISLADYRGKIVVLNFWASWCFPCRKEAADLQATSVDYEGEGVQFLGVNSRDNDAAGLAFVREFGITYPSAIDDAGALNDDYELYGLPATFVIGADGRIIYRFIGYLDGATIRRALDDALVSP